MQRFLITLLVPLALAVSAGGVAQEEGGQPPGVDDPEIAPAGESLVSRASTDGEEKNWEQVIDGWFGAVLNVVTYLPFYDIGRYLGVDPKPRTDDQGVALVGPGGRDKDGKPLLNDAGEIRHPVTVAVPAVVLWLIVAAFFFTFRMGFVNLRMFGHALAVVRGKYDNPHDAGEVTHFQALSSALSATVGLGNIAGVAIAVSVGGPGATFWMIVAGVLGMTLKFTECTLGQIYRKIDEHGRVSGGPMHYLRDGLAKRGLLWLGAPLAVFFTICCIGGSLAGGNAFQVFQSKSVLADQIPFFKDYGWAYGVIMAIAVGIVIVGGIRRIAQTAEKIVPLMCSVYVLASLAILVARISDVPAALGAIFSSAFTGEAIYGGAIGALITGFKRAAFSNEAGVGSASIAHSAAKTPYAVREGIVALLEPFVDTVVVCTMTALVIIITGVYDRPEYGELIIDNNGAALTNHAFKSVPFLAGWFPWVLLAAVVLFAFSTMISWSYYGERCWTRLFGARSSIVYKLLFLGFVVLGSIMSGKNALEFGDVMILIMAFPNIVGLYILSGEVKRHLDTYVADLRAGKFQVYK